MGIMSLRLSGPLLMRFGPKHTLLAGFTLIGIAMLMFARTPVDGRYAVDVLPAMILFGIGAGAGFPAIMTLGMSGATPSDSGLASGLINTSAQVGGAIGLAVLATLASERTTQRLADGASNAAALNSGYHLAYVVGAALVAVSLVIGAVVLQSPDMSAHAAAPVAHAEAPEVEPAAYAEAR
jgi:MFS family permease